VLRIQGQQALDAENYEKAVERFLLVLERAPEGLQRINAMYKIADAKLKTRQPESREEALDQLRQIQLELAPRAGSKYYEGELADASRSLLQVADFRLGQELLMQAGKSGDAALREQAADALNAFLEAYPDAPQAPSVMYNLGRLALQEGAFDRATELFNELSRQYADHPLGRDALYSLVKAALEEGQVEVAQDAVKRMVAAPEAYGPEKLFQVGDLMLENERFEEAADSFQLALDHPDSSENAPLLQRGLYNLGKAAKGAGRLEDAAAALGRLIQTYSSSALVFDAGLALADVHLSAEPPNVDAATAALVEAGRILRARPDPVNQARLGVAEGKMEVARGEPRKALSKWYGVALLRPENDAERQVVREAMLLAVNEAQTQATAGDADKWNIVAELSGLFVEYMPMDTRSDEMVRLRSRAESLRPKRNDEE
jgi:TolA-binding protein